MDLETDWWCGLLESADENCIVGLTPAPVASPKTRAPFAKRWLGESTEETGSPLIDPSSGTIPWLRAGEAVTFADRAFLVNLTATALLQSGA